MRNLISILLVTIVASGCGNGNKSAIIKQFKVTLNVTIEKDDKLEVYYLHDKMLSYKRKHRVAKKIKGSKSSQEVSFKLPENIYPTSLRLDLGENPNVNEIKILGVVMEYNGAKIELSNKEIASFFLPNKHVEYNKSTGTAYLSKIEGKYDPYFDSKPLLKLRLELMEKGIDL